MRKLFQVVLDSASPRLPALALTFFPRSHVFHLPAVPWLAPLDCLCSGQVSLSSHTPKIGSPHTHSPRAPLELAPAQKHILLRSTPIWETPGHWRGGEGRGGRGRGGEGRSSPRVGNELAIALGMKFSPDLAHPPHPLAASLPITPRLPLPHSPPATRASYLPSSHLRVHLIPNIQVSAQTAPSQGDLC